MASKPDKTERTFIMVKTDGVQRGLIGEIIKRFEQKGYKLVALKLLKVYTVLVHCAITIYTFKLT